MSTIATPKIASPKIPARVNAPTAPAAPTTGPAPTADGAVAEVAAKPAKEKKVRAEGEDAYGRVKHPVVGNKEVWPFASLAAVPADYNEKTHQPFKKTDFVNDFDFMDFNANQYEARAKRLRSKAAKLRNLGAGVDRKSASKLMRMTAAIEALKSKLLAEGINVEEVMAAAMSNDDATE